MLLLQQGLQLRDPGVGAARARATSSASKRWGTCWGQLVQASRLEDHHLIGPSAVVGWEVLARSVVSSSHDLGAAADLDAPTMGVVDQENEGFRVFLEVPLGDELPVALEIGEGQGRSSSTALEKARRAAAVLDIGLAFAVGRRDEEAAHLRDKGRQVRGDRRFASRPRYFHSCVEPRASLSGSGWTSPPV